MNSLFIKRPTTVCVLASKVAAAALKKAAVFLERKRERQKKDRNTEKISDFLTFGFTYQLVKGE
jgi:hypothetical protein